MGDGIKIKNWAKLKTETRFQQKSECFMQSVAFGFVLSYLGLACTGLLYNFVADLFHHHTHDAVLMMIENHSTVGYPHSTIDTVVSDRRFRIDLDHFANRAVAVRDGFGCHSCCSRELNFHHQNFETAVHFWLHPADICDDLRDVAIRSKELQHLTYLSINQIIFTNTNHSSKSVHRTSKCFAESSCGWFLRI